MHILASWFRRSNNRHSVRRSTRLTRLPFEWLERRDLLSGISFTDFSDLAGLTLLAKAAVTGDNVLRIAPAQEESRGNVWFAEKQFVSAGFETIFDFRMTGGGSHGMAFVIQNEGPLALGRNDRGMGYQMIANSLAIEFDTHQMPPPNSEPDDNHVSVQTRGTAYNNQLLPYSLGLANPAFDLNDGNVHTAKILYVPGTLSIYLDDLNSPLMTVAVDLLETLNLDVGRAWVGFTAHSGDQESAASTWQDHDVLNWEYHTPVDAGEAIGINDVSSAEGSSSASVLLGVHRLGSTSGTTILQWSTADGTATAGPDYTPVSGTITFNPGETYQAVTVSVIGDSSQEANESMLVNLTLLSGSATLVDSQGGLTILNDDVSISIDDASPTEGSSAWRFVDEFVPAVSSRLVQPRHIVFSPDGDLLVGSRSTDDVHRFDGATGEFVDVFADTAPGSLDDPRGLEFGPDGALYVGSADDRILRYDGVTGAYLGDFVQQGAGGLERAEGMTFGPDGNLYVSDRLNDRVLRFSGSTGAFMDEFVPSFSGGLNGVQDLLFGTDGNLYVSSNGTNQVLRYNGFTGAFVDAFVTSASGGLRAPMGISCGPDGDLYVTSNGNNSVLRYNGSTGAFVEQVASQSDGGLIRPQDVGLGSDGMLYVVSQAATDPQGTTNPILRYGARSLAVFDIRLSGPAGVPVTVRYLTGNGTATAGLDYASGSGTITFAPGETIKTIIVRTLDDGAYEGSETFVVNLSAPSPGATIADGQAVATIAENEPAPSISIGDVTATEGSTGQAVLSVTLSAAAAVPITVNYATANGTALAGSDFTAVSGQVTFLAGQVSQTVTIPILNDAVFEPTEAFVVNLTNPTAGATIADAQATVTILDNDPQPTKFYVVDDGSANRTYEYAAAGSAIENYALNSGNAAPRGAASNVAGDKVWVVDANRNVYVYNPSGGLLGSWTAGTLANNADVQGIATNGTDVWIVDAKSDKVFRYTGAATRLSGSQNAASNFALNSGNKDSSDIVTDGTSLWITNDAAANKVFKYSVAGSLLGSWTIDAANATPTGITLDPSNVSDLWIVDAGTDRVYQYTGAASRTSGSQSAAASFALAPGNTNPQGIADPPPAGQAFSLTGSAVDSVLADESSDDLAMDVGPASQFSAADHDAALFSILTEFEQAWARPKRKAGLLLA